MHAQASSAEPSTPSRSHLPIIPRRPKWDFADLKERLFFGGNGLKSAFVVALASLALSLYTRPWANRKPFPGLRQAGPKHRFTLFDPLQTTCGPGRMPGAD